MPSIQSAKNAYIAKNQMELQQYQQLLQQHSQPNNQFMLSQQQQQQQALFQHKNGLTANISLASSNTTSTKNLYNNNANTASSKLQSKAIANEITNNKNTAEIRRQQQHTAPNVHKNFDENTNGMSNDKKYTKRGNYYGPVYDVDHLATFTVGSKLGLLKAEDGMRKLRLMEKTQGIWTMECQLLVDTNYLIVYDKKNGQEVEMFPLTLVNDPTSVISDDKKDPYNNILLFTVFEDKENNNYNKKKSTSTKDLNIPSEMHIFQCTRTHSAEIVDEIYRAKEGRRNQPNNENVLTNTNINMTTPPNNHANSKHVINETVDDNNNLNTRTMHRANILTNHKHSSDTMPLGKIDLEVQILNHCFDDIERFVTRLQNSSEYFKELERRQKQRIGSAGKSPSKHMKSMGDGMLSFRAQMPSPQNYVDIFQKFKFSFNLLAKLKAHIHDPNAPELIHFLFTPLSLIVNTTKEQPYRGISKTVWQPLLTKDAKDLLLNCLTSKEQDLWLALGDSWTITEEEAKLQPSVYGHLEVQAYQPVFYDGWSPQISNLNESTNIIDRLAFATAAQVQAQKSYNQIQVPIQKSRNFINTQPQLNNVSDQAKVVSSKTNGNVDLKAANIRNYDEMLKWAVDLTYRGAKIYEVTHERQANNDKELTIKVGELLEVLDDKRNWWRLRNFYGNVGHAPVTILRPFETSSINTTNVNGHGNNNNHSSYQEQEKIKYEHVVKPLLSTSSSTSSDINQQNIIQSHDVFNELEENFKLKSRGQTLSNDSGSIRRNTNINNSLTKYIVSNFSPNGDSLAFDISPEQARKSSISTRSPSSTTNESDFRSSSSYLMSRTTSTNKIGMDNNNNNSNTSIKSNLSRLIETPPPTPSKFTLRKNQTSRNVLRHEEDKNSSYGFQSRNSSLNSQTNDSDSNQEILHAELFKRIHQNKNKKQRSLLKPISNNIDENSSPDEVKEFLIAKEFSKKVILMFGELNGAQLFSLNKLDFEKFCGKEEGSMLDSKIRVQKSICGFKETANELQQILEVRKGKSEN